MLKHLKLLCVIFVFGCSFGAYKAVAQNLEKFSCVADQTTGFKWDGKKWVVGTFPVSAEKIVIEEIAPVKSAIDDRVFNYAVKKAGYSAPVYQCTRHDLKDRRGNNMTCGGLGYGFSFDMRTMRFQEYHGLGYVDGQDRDGASPLITIGHCTRI